MPFITKKAPDFSQGHSGLVISHRCRRDATLSGYAPGRGTTPATAKSESSPSPAATVGALFHDAVPAQSDGAMPKKSQRSSYAMRQRRDRARVTAIMQPQAVNELPKLGLKGLVVMVPGKA